MLTAGEAVLTVPWARALDALIERSTVGPAAPRQLRVEIDNTGSGPDQRVDEARLDLDVRSAVVKIITEDEETDGPIGHAMSRRRFLVSVVGLPLWPMEARIDAAALETGQAGDVLRTPFEDGSVRQARRGRGLATWSVLAHIDDDAALARLKEWAGDHAHAWFAWPDPVTDRPRRVRVRGGAGGITARARVNGGHRCWEARLTLEGPA